MSEVPHELSDIGKGVWLLKNSIRCYPLMEKHQQHILQQAVNAKKSVKSNPIKVLDGLLEQRRKYETGLIEEIRGAIRLALSRNIDVANCLRFVEAIESMHGDFVTPEYQQFIFGALVELENLLAAIEGCGTTSDIAATIARKFWTGFRVKGSQNDRADAIAASVTDEEYAAFGKSGKAKRDYFYKLILDCDGTKTPKWLESRK